MLEIVASVFMNWLLIVAAGGVVPGDGTEEIGEPPTEAKLAMEGFVVPEGMTVELFAAEPNVRNPVNFCIDEQGRVFVAETFRQQKGVEDNRNHMKWLLDDLAAQTVEDRVAYFRKHLGAAVEAYGENEDRIRVLEDRDGDGRADRATVYADGFDTIATGTGAGLLAHRGTLYYTCIPDVWMLKDTNADLQADVRKSLHYGYGVRTAFRGHDLHGLTLGPDGRLYFSIGDRGFNVQTEDKHFVKPDTGAVFRCELDGSDLEVFAYGLRNPQELAFDNFGNLFTGDNNSDSGDRARWVYVVEGSDSGWRMYYQYLSDRGPWNRERIWYPFQADEETTAVQPAYVLPPVAHLGDGPSGLVHYPGIGLPERYENHFFMADFRGTASRSGVRSFAVQPKGAGFELVDSQEFIWSTLVTDVDFGYDGKLYLTDWIDGWNGLDKGRVYTFADTAAMKATEAASVAKLMAEGFDEQSLESLVDLLTHRDQRVRREAQFELAARKAVPRLEQVATDGDELLARIHAIWGLGQIARRESIVSPTLTDLLIDDDAEIRAQAARVLGDIRHRPAEAPLIAALQDESPRVQSFAASALARVGSETAVPHILDLLNAKADKDAVIRHAGVMALVGSESPAAIVEAGKDPRFQARLGALLAMRRLKMPEIAMFLNDADPRLTTEAATAIHDLPIAEALPALAEVPLTSVSPDALVRRVLSAAYRLGDQGHAEFVADLAADGDFPETIRLEAIFELANWAEPPELDRVTNEYRPLEARPAAFIKSVLRSRLPAMLSSTGKIREAATALAGKYGIQEVGPLLREILAAAGRPGDERAAALTALDALDTADIAALARFQLNDKSFQVRTAARRIIVDRDPASATPLLKSALDSPVVAEQQAAIKMLGEVGTPSADAVLLEMAHQLAVGTLPPELQLDVLEAAEKNTSEAFQQTVAAYRERNETGSKLSEFRMALAGGDAERGRELFFGRSDLSCRRCHKIAGEGGEVGPDLSKIGADKNREYLLEAIVDPNKAIAKGFETVVLALADGRVVTGVLREDDGENLHLMLGIGEQMIVPKDDIDDQAKGKSSMPEDLMKNLSRRDVRDLVEYLSLLRGTNGSAE